MKISRYPIVFGVTSVDLGDFIETIRPQAVDRTLRTNSEVVALRNHDSTLPLGRRSAGTLKLVKDSHGLLAEIDVDENITYVGDLVRLIERGDAKGGSFAFTTLDDAWSLVDGQAFREILDMDLREVSLGVSFPAYAATSRDAGSRDTRRTMSIAMAERLVRQGRS